MKPDTVIQTHTEEVINVFSPDPGVINIVDIAHALAMNCRFNGHVHRFYCVTPGTKVLTADLDWVNVEEAVMPLLAFDEEPTAALHTAGVKRIRKSLVAQPINYGRIKRKLVKLLLSDGSEITASEEHPWLVSTKVSNNQSWLTCAEIVEDLKAGSTRYINRWMPRSWEGHFSGSLSDYERGWLAGIFDGEGHLTYGTTGGPSSMALGVSQNPGLVLDEITRLLDKLGVDYACVKNPASDVRNVTVRGAWYDRIALLKYIGSIRLLAKAKAYARQPGFFALKSYEKLEIVGYEELGEGDVIALETSSHTYFAEGLGAHNSVAEHCVHVANIVLRITGDPVMALAGLLHDASEAYIADLASPIKKQMQGYKAVEEGLQKVIYSKYALPWPEPAVIKEVDLRMLVTEARDLMPASWLVRHWDKYQALPYQDLHIPGWSWDVAKTRYLIKFDELVRARHDANNA